MELSAAPHFHFQRTNAVTRVVSPLPAVVLYQVEADTIAADSCHAASLPRDREA